MIENVAFFSQIEPKKFEKTHVDKNWILAMQQ